MKLAELARIVFQSELENMQRSLAGYIADDDPIMLHDLRVAERRTRAALSEFKDILPDSVVHRFRERFRWLHQITNPVRDLDVSISHIPSYRRKVSFFHPGVLRPALIMLRSRRQEARGQLSEILRSGQVDDILAAWSVQLEDGIAYENTADLPSAAEHGCRRICERYRSLQDKALDITPQSSPSEYHGLRIGLKKLRYQIEFYKLALGKKGISSLLNKLKRSQDILGGYQDAVVEIEYIHQLAEDLSKQGSGRQPQSALERLIDNYQKLITSRKKRSFQQVRWLSSEKTAVTFQRIFSCHPPLLGSISRE